MPTEDTGPNLGACCGCGAVDGVRNLVMLTVRAATPGYGWGCLVCGLPSDGAVAVLCDDCMRHDPPRIEYAVDGPVSLGRRLPLERLTEPYDHDLSKHPELQAPTFEEDGVCLVCGCTDETPCYDEAHGPCFWITSNVCSACIDKPEAAELLNVFLRERDDD